MESQGTPTSPNLAQASASLPAGYDVAPVAVPPQGQIVTVPVVPGMQYRLDVAEVKFSQEGTNLVAEAAEGGRVVFEDYFTFASSELPPAVALAEGGVVPQEQILAELGNPDLNAAEPAAGGPGAGAGATGGIVGGGAAFTPYDPGDIGPGLNTLDLLGNLDMLFDAPEPPEERGIDLAEGSFGISIVADTGLGVFSTIFEDNQPFANTGDTTPTIPVLNIVFAPTDDEVVTETRLTGFPVGMQLTLTDGTVVDITAPDQVVVLGPGLETGIRVTGVPADADADFTISVSMDIADAGGGTTATLTASGTVVVDAVADLAQVAARDSYVAAEDNATNSGGTFTDGLPRFAIGFTAGLADTDGSEEITSVQVTLTGLIGATLAVGVTVGWGGTPLWTTGGGEEQVTVISVPGTVLGAAGAEVLLQVTATVGEGGNIVLTMVPVTPGGEALSGDDFDLTQVATLDLSALQVTLPPHADDSFSVKVAVTTEETNTTDAELPGFDNNVAVREVEFDVTVRAVADAPEISVENKSYNEDQPVSGLVSVVGGVASYYAGFSSAVTDTDGSESLTQVKVTFTDDSATRNPPESLSIGGIAVGGTETSVTVAAEYVNADGDLVTGTVSGTASFVGGVLTLTFADGARVQQVYLDNTHGTPLVLGLPEHSDDDYTVSVATTSTETNPIDDTPLHASTTSTAEFKLEIRAVADTPTITWSADTGESLQVSYVATNANFQNLLGVYIVGPNGEPTDAQLIFADTGDTDPGTILASLPPGAEYRFFLIEKGVTLYGSDLDALNDQLSLTEGGDGKPVLKFDGTVVKHIYYSETTHNFDSADHVVVGYNPDGSLTVGFEDLSDGGDLDYNDVVIRVTGGTQSFEDYNNGSDGRLTFGAGFVASTPDQDGSEHLSNITVTFSGLADAAGTTVRFGSDAIGDTITIGGVDVAVTKAVDPASGTITLTFSPSVNLPSLNLGDLNLQLPRHSDDDFRVDVSVTTTESDPEGGVATTSASHSSGFDVIVDAVADRPTMATAPTSANVGETRTITLSATAAFTDVTDGSESHYLLVQVPGATGDFTITTVTGADGNAYSVITVTDGVISGTGLPSGFDYSSLANGTYVVAQVDNQLTATNANATLSVALKARTLDDDISFTAKTYGIAIETNPTDGELDLDNNIAITQGSTWTVTITDDVPSAYTREITVLEDGLTKTENTETGTTATLFNFHNDVAGASAEFSTTGITVTGIVGNPVVTWTLDGDGNLLGTVAGDGTPSIRLSLVGTGNGITVKAELLKTFDTIDTNVKIGNVSVIGTDGDGDTATAKVTVNVTDDLPTISTTVSNAGIGNVAKTLEGGVIEGTMKLDAGADGGTITVKIDGGTAVELTTTDNLTYSGTDPLTGTMVTVTLGEADPDTAQRTGTWSLTTPNVAVTALHTLVFTITDGDNDTASATTLHYLVADHLPRITSANDAISIHLAEGDAGAHAGSAAINFGTDIGGSTVVFQTADGVVEGGASGISGITVSGVSETITWNASADGSVLTGYVDDVAVLQLTLSTAEGGTPNQTVAQVTAQILNSAVFNNIYSGNPTGAMTIGGLSLLGSDGGHDDDTDAVVVPVTITVADGVPSIAAGVAETFTGNVAFVGEGRAVSGTIELTPGPDGLQSETIAISIKGEGDTEATTYSVPLNGSSVMTSAGLMSVTVNPDGTGTWTLQALDLGDGATSGNDYDKVFELHFLATDGDTDIDSSPTVNLMVIDTSRLGGGTNPGGDPGTSLEVTVDNTLGSPSTGVENVGAVTETEQISGNVNIDGGTWGDLGQTITVTDPETGGSVTFGKDGGTATLPDGRVVTMSITDDGRWTLTSPNVDGSTKVYDVTFGTASLTGTARVLVLDSTPVVSDNAISIAVPETQAPGATGSAAVTVDFGHDLDGSSITFANATGGGVTGIVVANLPPGTTIDWTSADGGKTLIGSINGAEAVRLAITTSGSDPVTAQVTATLASGQTPDSGNPLSISGVVIAAVDGDGDTVSVPVNVSVVDDVPTISATGSDFSLVGEMSEAVTGVLTFDGGSDGLATLTAVIRDASGAVVETVVLSPNGTGGYSGTGSGGSVVTVGSDNVWSLVPGNVDSDHADYSVSFTATDTDGDTATSESFNYVVVDGKPEIVGLGRTAPSGALPPVSDDHQQVSGTITLVSVDPVGVMRAKIGDTIITLNKDATGEYSGGNGAYQMRMSLTQSGSTWSGVWVLETAMASALTSYKILFQAEEAAAGTDPLGGDGDATLWTYGEIEDAPTVSMSDPTSVNLTADGDLVVSGSITQSGTGSLTLDGASVSGSTWSYTLDANAGEDKTDHSILKTDTDGDVAKATAHFVAVTMEENEIGDLVGTSANEILVGSNESNTLDGGDGNDRLFGRDGDDVLIGGAGDDILTGGEGADTFRFTSVDDGKDTITDFQLGVGGDTIDLDALFDALGTADASRDDAVSVSHQSGNTYVVGVAGHSDFSITVQVENPGGASPDDVAATIKAQVDTHG